jgi:hypothetical protein
MTSTGTPLNALKRDPWAALLPDELILGTSLGTFEKVKLRQDYPPHCRSQTPQRVL